MADEKFKLSGISSVALHAAGNSHAEYSHIPPIYATSTFTFDTAEQGMERFAGKDKENIYTRWGNPTFKVAEQTISALEAFGLKDENGNPLQLKSLFTCKRTEAAMDTTTMFSESNLKSGDTLLSHFLIVWWNL